MMRSAHRQASAPVRRFSLTLLACALAPAAHAACHFQQFGKRGAERHFVVARFFHVARDREDLRTG